MNNVYLIDLPLNKSVLEKLHQWRSSPEVVKNSFRSETQSLEEFLNFFEKKYHSIPHLPPKAILLNHDISGVIYFEKGFKENECVLSIYLDPQKMGKKIGARAISLAKETLLNQGYQRLIAFIKPENVIAQKAFAKAGFIYQDKVLLPKYGQKHQTYKLEYNQSTPRKTFVIAEAGSNCCLGDDKKTLELAKVMIEKAYWAGADAIKFQCFESHSVYVENAGIPKYLNENINDIFRRNALPTEIIAELYQHANYVGIEWMCSSFSEETFEKINPFVKKHKIASYEIRHLRLLEKAAKSQKPLYLSTGAANLEDIEWAIEVFQKNGGKELTLMQCTAQYPAQAASLNLRCIPYLQKQFNLPIGLSDHSEHPLYAPIAAVSLGATAIEKHFTINKSLPGPDQSFAIDYKDLRSMCEAISETESILGLAKKEIFPQEEELAAFARRGLQTTRAVKQGELLKEGVNFQILRSGQQRLGMHPKYIQQIEGKIAACDIPLGKGLQNEDILW